MGIFSQIAEAVEGADVTWRNLAGEHEADHVCAVAWCGEHEHTEHGIDHRRTIATAQRADGTLILRVTLNQWTSDQPGGGLRFPSVWVEPFDADGKLMEEQELILALAMAPQLADVVYFSSAQWGEVFAAALSDAAHVAHGTYEPGPLGVFVEATAIPA